MESSPPSLAEAIPRRYVQSAAHPDPVPFLSSCFSVLTPLLGRLRPPWQFILAIPRHPRLRRPLAPHCQIPEPDASRGREGLAPVASVAASHAGGTSVARGAARGCPPSRADEIPGRRSGRKMGSQATRDGGTCSGGSWHIAAGAGPGNRCASGNRPENGTTKQILAGCADSRRSRRDWIEGGNMAEDAASTVITWP